MGVDQTGHQRPAATVDHGHIVGLNNGQGLVRHRLNQIVLHQDMHVLDEAFPFCHRRY